MAESGERNSIADGVSVTDVNADTKFDPSVLRHININILFRHTALDFVGPTQGVDTSEFDRSAVTRILDNASAIVGNLPLEAGRQAMCGKLPERAIVRTGNVFALVAGKLGS